MYSNNRARDLSLNRAVFNPDIAYSLKFRIKRNTRTSLLCTPRQIYPLCDPIQQTQTRVLAFTHTFLADKIFPFPKPAIVIKVIDLWRAG